MYYLVTGQTLDYMEDVVKTFSAAEAAKAELRQLVADGCPWCLQVRDEARVVLATHESAFAKRQRLRGNPN